MKALKKNYPYLIIFIIFLTITFLAPRTGDDWGNYLEGALGIKHMIDQSIGMYFDWEGRFISRILINFLTYYKTIWNIINSILITSIIYLIVEIIKPKNKKFVFLSATLIILLMNIKTFSEIIVWIAGNITYLFVIPLLLFYFNYMMNHQTNNKKTIIIFAFLNIIMTMLVEHMAVILVTGNILILISRYLKTKKIDKELIIYTLSSLLGLIAMLLSPGSAKRSLVENLEFKSLSIFGKIFYNLPNFIYYTFTVNYTLIPLLVIANYYLIKKQVKNKTLKIISYLYLLIIPLINSGIYLYQNVFYTNISINNNPLLITYFISYILINLVLIYNSAKNKKENKTLFFYLLGITSNFVMLVSPTWGYRTSLATYIFLAISYLLIIDQNIKENKIINYTLTSVCILFSIFYLILYTSVYLQSKENEENIKTQLREDKDVIEIARYPSFVSCNINPENAYHLDKFKNYYDIPQEKEITIIPNHWKGQIIYQKKKIH